MEVDSKNQPTNEVIINEKSMEILVAKFIPTSQYFERSFEMLNGKLEDFKEEQREFRKDIGIKFQEVNSKFEQVDRRFEQIDKRFEQVDKRFEQVDEKLNDFKKDVDKRFEQVDKRFEQVDKRFEQVDKRFEQINQKHEKIDESIHNLALKVEQLTKAQETTIRDYIIERDRHYDSKFNNLRMYNLATISLVAGVILKMAGIINI